ncbi:MAG: 50S ribosomal protein L18 [Methanophagales archaeon ANME-1-THS]|nr:MAG: 50S ribosomal protein L18 [Methanophagales archaeon ANME-1-THS]
MGGAKGPAYRVPFRRRRNGKTDYQRRLRLLLSRKPRVVVRKSNRLIRMQLVSTAKDGDHTLVAAMSSELASYGYRGGTSNTVSAYLTGLLLGTRALAAGYHEGVLDTGRYTPAKGANIYAALKGAVETGMDIPCDSSVFPTEERLSGAHIAQYKGDTSIIDMVRMIKEKIMSAQGNAKEDETSPE